MHLDHNPEIRDAVPPASLPLLDGRARGVANRQLDRLERHIGRDDRAKLPGQRDIPLNGYSFELDDISTVDLSVETNGHGELTAEDRAFVDARYSLAVLRSRERSRGSRMWNFAFRRDRGDGYGNTWEIDEAEEVYQEHLNDFIARKVTAHIADHAEHDNEADVTEIVAKAVIQEQQQMSALEHMAAEVKSGGSGLFNLLRNHKALRIAVGIGLGVGATIAGASGLWTVAVPLFGARAALSASGGYMVGRTGWDAVQGIRTRGLPNDDIRMASDRTHDISGRLSQPEGAFHRFINILGAEARAGSRKSRRQQLIHRMSMLDHVRQYYTVNPAGAPVNPNRLDFSGGYNDDDIYDRVGLLFDNIISPRHDERLASDQTQSRRRHIAGLVGGTIFAGLTVSGAVELLNFSVGAHEHVASMASNHNTGMTQTHGGGGTQGTESSPSTSSGSLSTSGAMKAPSGNVIAVPPESTISINETAAQANTGLAANGASVGVLHVQPGGGFISTLESQYGMTPDQANATYTSMYGQLHGAPGTYLVGSDIRIAAPGDFQLSPGASSILTQHLTQYGEMAAAPTSAAETAANVTNITITETSAHTGTALSHPITETVNGTSTITIEGAKGSSEQIILGGAQTSATSSSNLGSGLKTGLDLSAKADKMPFAGLKTFQTAPNTTAMTHGALSAHTNGRAQLQEFIRHQKQLLEDDDLVAA